MKRIIASVVLAASLSGCSAGYSNWSSDTLDYAKLNFIGLPTALGLGLTGSSTPITDSLSLTNKHVAYPLLKTIVKTHDKCDVALIAQNNVGEVVHQWAQLGMHHNVKFYGYSGLTALPTTSSGKVVNFKRDSNGCLVALTTAGGVGGMSGGAVVNDDGKLVGIIKGVEIGSGLTVVIPYQSFESIMPISIRDQVKKDYTYGAD